MPWRAHLSASNMSKPCFCSVTSLVRSVATRSSEVCLLLLRQANLELSFLSHFEQQSLPVQTICPRASQQQGCSEIVPLSHASCTHVSLGLEPATSSGKHNPHGCASCPMFDIVCCHMNSCRHCSSLTLECLAHHDAPLHSCHGVLQQSVMSRMGSFPTNRP